MKYWVYILLCSDVRRSLYTGYTTDINRRIYEHNYNNKGAKYTRGKRPVKLLYEEEFDNKSDAMKREYAIKQLSRHQKINLAFPKK